MNKIIIDCREDMVRTAVMEDKKLVELIIDKKENESLIGNIYAGIVKNILPNQFAFIDIGEEKNGFLFLNDKKESLLYSKENKKLIIKNGDSLLVQVVKDETGQKGPYVTTQVSFSGRLCVLIKSEPEVIGIAVSKKITDENERKRLKLAASEVLPKGYELIIRTNCEGRQAEEIQSEMYQLLEKSQKIFNRWEYLKSPCIVDKQENFTIKNLKDLFNEDTEEVIINSEIEFEKIKNAVRDYFEGAENRVKFYGDGSKPIFRQYLIETQIDRILCKKVWLKSGGFIIIEQTEACVVIDVNSGKFSGKKNHEQSSLKLNIEACEEIVRQMRLRNLCGIIIVDFIDMEYEESKNELIKAFSNELKKDRISTNLVGITNLGLMEVTRKKMREPLINILKQECKACGGVGRIYKGEIK